MSNEQDIICLLREVRGLVRYHKSCSVTGYPKDNRLLSFLRGCEWPSCGSFVEKKQGPAPAVKLEGGHGAGAQEESGSEKISLAQVEAEILSCSSCGLAQGRPGVVPGIGAKEKVKLFVVGHWLPASGPSALVFGEDEDVMLQKMLAAINLSLEDVYVSNAIKCVVRPGVQPRSEHIDICLSHLRRQIAAAAPLAICSMGMVATKAMLNLPHPLSRLRGRFHAYRGTGGEIPLMPTYHPSYLLQNQEMKKAAWHDLLLLQKHLSGT